MQLIQKSFIRAAAVVAAATCLGSGVWAGPKESHPVAVDVPIFGAFVGIPHVDLNYSTGAQHVIFRGVGVARNMDDVTCRSDDEWAFPYPVLDSEAPTPELKQTPTVLYGHYTIVGDDGDTLEIYITAPPGKFTLDQATGHGEFSGTFMVTKGTGRYRNATGSGVFVGSADAAPEGQPWIQDGELHIRLVGHGRWAFWGTLSGVRTEPCHGR